MSKKDLLLVISGRMDANKKEDRNEQGIIRMSKKTRTAMSFSEEAVELWPKDMKDAATIASRALMLDIFMAYKEDIKNVRQMIKAGELPPDAINRVGFVTSRTYKRVMGEESKKTNSNIWVSKGIVDTIIGADPEFVLQDTAGTIVHADSLLSHYGQIASDGAMAELRPSPGINPGDLVTNIMSLLTNDELTDRIRELNWKSGICYKGESRDYPIGGHIHFGNPVKIAKMSEPRRLAFFAVVTKILDELIAVPLTRIEGSLGNYRRTKSRTGRFGIAGDMRLCNGRLEYRTISGIWLSHPIFTKIVFGVAKSIIDAVYDYVAQENFSENYLCAEALGGVNNFHSAVNFVRTFDSWETVKLAKDMACTEQSSTVRSILDICDRTKITKSYLDKWLTKMKAFPTFSKYEEYIINFYRLLRLPVKELDAKLSTNIKENWIEGKDFVLTEA